MIKKIIIENTKNLTSQEQHEMFLKQAEKAFNTGPIIGEARKVIFILSRNLLVRDLYLDSVGVDEKKREEIFRLVEKYVDAKDEKILKERAKIKEL